MTEAEREEQRHFHTTTTHSMVEHSYSSSTLVGEERLADDNKRLRMLVEKLVHKIDVDRTKFNRVQVGQKLNGFFLLWKSKGKHT